MKFQIDQGIEILASTPGVLRSMLAGLGDLWITGNYGEGTFSPFDVVGHLIHGERTDWIPRAKIILAHGESQPFEPFDRYAMFEESKGRSIAELLDTFESLRRENIQTLGDLNLTPERLNFRGTHPALGPVTLGQLLATWVVHDLNHLAQIAKAMAFQYADNVGPWREYLTIFENQPVRREKS